MTVQAYCFDPKAEEVRGQSPASPEEPPTLHIGGVTFEFNIVDDQSLNQAKEALLAIHNESLTLMRVIEAYYNFTRW